MQSGFLGEGSGVTVLNSLSWSLLLSFFLVFSLFAIFVSSFLHFFSIC